ncbi:MAG: class I SAM-dependent methyltransferase [Patescibacteria group bacterium]
MEEQKEIRQRYLDLSSAIEQNPHDPEIQGQVLNLARQEEGTEKSQKGFFGRVALTEMEGLFKKMKEAKRLEDYYRLVVEKCSTGDLWYDIIVGRRYKDDIVALGEEIGKKEWDRGLDIGCGTGNVTRKITKHCKSFVGLDLLPFLLGIARERIQKSKVGFVAGEAARLPFKENAFDLVTSNALVCFLSREDLIRFIIEVNRVLKPGGSYFQPIGSAREEPLESGKALLAKLIDEMIPPSREEFGRTKKASQTFLFGFRMLDFTPIVHENKKRGTAILELKKSF